MNAILFKAPGRSSSRPTVVLTFMSLTAKSSTPPTVAISRALSSARAWARRNCKPNRVVAAIARFIADETEKTMAAPNPAALFSAKGGER